CSSVCCFFACHALSEPSTQVYTASIGNAMSSICDTANSGTVGTSAVSQFGSNEVKLDSLTLTVGECACITDVTRLGRGEIRLSGDSGSTFQNSISHANARPNTNCPSGSLTGR